MAKGLQRKRQRQQDAAELARLRILEAELTAPKPAFTRPPVHRPTHTQWDWQCGRCGHLNYGTRAICHRHLCIGTRTQGYVVVGSFRGSPQNGPEVEAAVRRQQCTMSLPSAYQSAPQGAHTASTVVAAHANTRTVHSIPLQKRPQAAQQQQQPPQQHAPTRRVPQKGAAPAHIERKPPTEAGGGGYALPTGPAAGKTEAEPQKRRSYAVYAEADNDIDEDHDADDNESATHFEDADADPAVLRRRCTNLARKLERKRKKLANEHKRVEEQQIAIAEQEAELVLLQAAADSTSAEIDVTQRNIAELSTQIARIEAEKVKVLEALDSAEDDEQKAAVCAQECLTRTIAAFQNYKGQPLQIQGLLQQFVASLDAMRAAEAVADPKQCSLQQAFERAAAHSVAGGAPHAEAGAVVLDNSSPTVVAAPQQFDIRSNVSAAESGPENMCVVGQNPGEKRKQEHLEDAQRTSQREAAERERAQPSAAVEDETSPTQPVEGKEANIEIDAEGIKATPAPVSTSTVQKSYDKRSNMLGDLEAQVTKQAAAVRQRLSPYGHG